MKGMAGPFGAGTNCVQLVLCCKCQSDAARRIVLAGDNIMKASQSWCRASARHLCSLQHDFLQVVTSHRAWWPVSCCNSPSSSTWSPGLAPSLQVKSLAVQRITVYIDLSCHSLRVMPAGICLPNLHAQVAEFVKLGMPLSCCLAQILRQALNLHLSAWE